MLTLITVSYRSKPYLDINYRLVKALNPDTPFTWIVIQNTPPDECVNDIAMDDPRFQVYPGASLTEAESNTIGYGSYHHVKGLHIGLSYAKDDHIMVLDPDCFIIQADWIRQVIDHCQQQGICFWGTPYHPSRHFNYRYFPTAICMLINRKILQTQYHQFDLDFSFNSNHAFYDKTIYWAISRQTGSFKRFKRFFTKKQIERPLRPSQHAYYVIREFIRRRVPQFKLTLVFDTGYKLYKTYYGKVPTEVLQVVYQDPRGRKETLLEHLLPDQFRTYPRADDFIVPTSRYTTLLEGLFPHCEQYVWRGHLFAIHVSRVSYGIVDADNQRKMFDQILSLSGVVQSEPLEALTQ
jgi:hypothetical protein